MIEIFLEVGTGNVLWVSKKIIIIINNKHTYMFMWHCKTKKTNFQKQRRQHDNV